MRTDWKKPWALLLWIFSRDDFTLEEGPGPKSISRFGSKGFWRWLFASEAGTFREESEMETRQSHFGPGGFWKWLVAPEKFVEELQKDPDHTSARDDEGDEV